MHSRVLVYFLSQCWGHSVLWTVPGQAQHPCQRSLPAPPPLTVLERASSVRRLLFFECSYYSPGASADLQARSPARQPRGAAAVLAAGNLKSRRRSRGGGGACWSTAAGCTAPGPGTNTWERGVSSGAYGAWKGLLDHTVLSDVDSKTQPSHSKCLKKLFYTER